VLKDKRNSEHYFFGENCDGWIIDNSNELGIIEEKMPPHTKENNHFHINSKQMIFVKSGTAIFDMEGVQYKVEANQYFMVVPGLSHKIINDADEDLEFIVISHPSSIGDRFEL
jgi:mannose-6-phosphate isomerase-like protein (cupin superfamily)